MRRLLAALLVSLAAAAAAPLPAALAAAGDEAPRPVGIVSRVQGEAVAQRGETSAVLGPSAPVAWRDGLRTGAESRLQVALLDEGSLILGENAHLVVDELTVGEADSLLQLTVDGAFRLLTGALHHRPGTTIVTPVATIGIRGTDVWGGPIDGEYGVFVLSGVVEVTTPGGTVTLTTPGTGTTITSPDAAPSDPIPWPEDKIARAVETVTFGR
ncbi:FecR family protein [Caenispirillum bisanense]|uniref:FecR family protein n=1 Tax=Caenispirillum bisanense TaxID=414052 RepID=UPI0031E1F0B4